MRNYLSGRGAISAGQFVFHWSPAFLDLGWLAPARQGSPGHTYIVELMSRERSCERGFRAKTTDRFIGRLVPGFLGKAEIIIGCKCRNGAPTLVGRFAWFVFEYTRVDLGSWPASALACGHSCPCSVWPGRLCSGRINIGQMARALAWKSVWGRCV